VAHAYTPGLKLNARATLRRRRVLPLAGRVLVEVGQRVEAPSVIAEAELPGPVHPANVAGLLGVRPQEIKDYMLKRQGDPVKKDEPIAQTRPWIRWLQTVCRSPVQGTVESVSDVTGQVMLREPPQKVQVSAYVSGTVEEILPGEGAVVKTQAALVQGIFGVGGESHGSLRVITESAGAVAAPEALDSSCRKCIIVAGALATAELVEAACAVEASALVVGGMHAAQLRRVLGYEIGVAVTGSEQIGLTLILTEGFGQVPMARRTFELLAGLEGMPASASGVTQIRAGVVRPEIVVPLAEPLAEEGGEQGQERSDGLREGDRVRIIRRPHFGAMGKVVELSGHLVRVETEAMVRALRVRTDEGETLSVPRANVEIVDA